MFVYQLPPGTSDVLLTDRVIFTVTNQEQVDEVSQICFRTGVMLWSQKSYILDPKKASAIFVSIMSLLNIFGSEVNTANPPQIETFI